jgi:hypothetical protein
MLIAWEPRSQAVNGIERTRADVVKRSPVEWDEVPSARPLEEAQCVS